MTKHWLLITALAALPFQRVMAQKAKEYTPIRAQEYTLRPELGPVGGFKHLADTAGKPARVFAAGAKVRIIGEGTPRWALVETADWFYFIPQQAIAGLNGRSVLSIFNPTLPFNSATGRIGYEEVVQVPGADKNELYARGKIWFASTFTSARSVIHTDNKEGGVLEGKGWQQVYVDVLSQRIPEKLWFTVTLSFKDGRYKQSVSEFRFELEPSQYNRAPKPGSAEEAIADTKKDGSITWTSASYKQVLAEEISSIKRSIQAAMAKPAPSGDW